MKTIGIYTVRVYTKSPLFDWRDCWEIEVASNSIREARRAGVNYFVELININKKQIVKTDVDLTDTLPCA